MIQWLRLWTPSAGGPGSLPGQGTRSHMLQLRLSTAKQINTYLKNYLFKVYLGKNILNIKGLTIQVSIYLKLIKMNSFKKFAFLPSTIIPHSILRKHFIEQLFWSGDNPVYVEFWSHWGWKTFRSGTFSVKPCLSFLLTTKVFYEGHSICINSSFYY